MKRAVLFGVLWLVATAATGAVAWGAVHLAGEQTSEQAVRPMTVRQVEELAASSTMPAATTAATTSHLATTTTASPTIVPATSTSAPAASTTTSTPTVAARQTRGGTVVVSLQDGRLSLVSATPAAGYAVEVEETGPERVVVIFEDSAGDEVEVRASVSGGEVAFEVGTGGEED